MKQTTKIGMAWSLDSGEAFGFCFAMATALNVYSLQLAINI